jgi:hypothetical protein
VKRTVGLVVLIGAAILAVPFPTAATNQQSGATTPSCMRRISVNSNPCGAMIYIDGTQVGRTPMSFPMPTGGYTLFLFAPGHQGYAQRIHVTDAPLAIHANLVPLP